MPYPDSLLTIDQADPPFGGAPKSNFGPKERTFIDNVMRVLEAAYLTYTRAPCRQLCLVTQTAVRAGDVAVWSASLAPSGVTGVTYYAGGYKDVTGARRLFGVFAEPASINSRARVIVDGVVPANVTALASGASGYVTIDATTGRLRLAALGEAVFGEVDARGNVFLFSTHMGETV